MRRLSFGSGRLRTACVLLLAVSLAACGSNKSPVASAGSRPSARDSGWALQRVQEAIADLNRGQPDKAREQLLKALKVSPGDMLARNLLRQIDTDPKLLLGEEHFSYTLKDGESLSDLAQRYLRDPMLAYALARYNGLASPLDARAGQSLMIPGRKPAPPVPAKKPAPVPAKKPPVASAKPAPKAAQPAANPAQAARLRGQGLAALNAGAVNKAVALLRQALGLDPGNALIKRDLERALRVQATLSGRK